MRPSLWFNLALKLDNPYYNGQNPAEVLWRTIICIDGSSSDYLTGSEYSDFGRFSHDYMLDQIPKSIDFEELLERALGNDIDDIRWPQLDELAKSSHGAVPSTQDLIQFVRRLKLGDGQLDDDKDAFVRRSEVFARLEQKEKRTLFCTAGKAFGSGPSGLQQGDRIAFLIGATVPFALRPVGDGQFFLVGEAYVHGFMHGEAWNLKEYESQEITLV